MSYTRWFGGSEQKRSKRKAEDHLDDADHYVKRLLATNPTTGEIGGRISTSLNNITDRVELYLQNLNNPTSGWARDRNTNFESITHADTVEAYRVLLYRDLAPWGGNVVRSLKQRVYSPTGYIYDGIHYAVSLGTYKTMEKGGEVGHCRYVPGNGWTRQDLLSKGADLGGDKAILLSLGEPLPAGCNPNINILQLHGLVTPWTDNSETKWTVLDLTKVDTIRHNHPLCLIPGTMDTESCEVLDEQADWYAHQLVKQNGDDRRMRAAAQDPQQKAPEPIFHKGGTPKLCTATAGSFGTIAPRMLAFDTILQYESTPNFPAEDAQDSDWNAFDWNAYESEVMRIIEARAARAAAQKKNVPGAKTQHPATGQPSATSVPNVAKGNTENTPVPKPDTRGPVTQAASAITKMHVNTSGGQATGGAGHDHSEDRDASRDPDKAEVVGEVAGMWG